MNLKVIEANINDTTTMIGKTTSAPKRFVL